MSTVVVIGAGLMGSGIAQVSAVAGHEVVMRDVDDAALARGMAGIEKSLARFVSKNAVTQADADAALARITTTTSLEDAVELYAQKLAPVDRLHRSFEQRAHALIASDWIRP